MTKAALTTQEGLLAKLSELGGGNLNEDDIVHEGRRFILPVGMSDEAALGALADKIKSDREVTTFHRMYPFRPWDAAYAVSRVFKQLFGFSYGKMEKIETPFGVVVNPPSLVDVETSFGVTEQIPWGALALPIIPEAELSMSSYRDNEHGEVFVLQVKAPRKHRFVIEGLFEAIDNELKNHSIYRGKAFSVDGKFLDLSRVDESRVHYSSDVRTQLQAHLWSLIEHTEAHRQLNLPLKRAILLAGDYGQGKTLAGWLTAAKAAANGWTFIHLRPGKDKLSTAMQTARMYAPAVVFAEDIDSVKGANGQGGSSSLSSMLDLLDGITAKGADVVLVTTTNHPERLTRGMLRPGRLDSVITIGSPDREGIEHLIRANVHTPIDDGTNFDQVAAAMADFPAAFVKEVGDRAVRFALLRDSNPQHVRLSTDDFVNAAIGLRPQYDMMKRGGSTTVDTDAPAVMLADTIDKAYRVRENMEFPEDEEEDDE